MPPERHRCPAPNHLQWTGGGITAGIDFALTLIAELKGEDAARSVQLLLEYTPTPPFDSGLPDMASPHIRETVNARMADALADARRRVHAFRLSATPPAVEVD